ncbi:hypothetical protein QBC39DRAFT_341188 [Podospora conica]|nr:hypothetical protein QBC39DRAFT_341188 [Schizothecium conicum]
MPPPPPSASASAIASRRASPNLCYCISSILVLALVLVLVLDATSVAGPPVGRTTPAYPTYNPALVFLLARYFRLPHRH